MGSLAKAAASAFRDPQAWDTVTLGGVSFKVTKWGDSGPSGTQCKCGAPMTASMVMCPGCAADAVMSGRWEKDPELRARCYAAAHEDHPRPGTPAWLVKSVAYLCSIPKDDVLVTEDHARALVIVRVPRSVTADTMRAAAAWLKDAAPVYVCIRLEYAIDPREQGPGIAARVPVRPSVRPDVVACAEWDEKWGWA